jgi:hypothetical protein
MEDWFRVHGPYPTGMAREPARADLTARRDGYMIRWAQPWVCQLLEPDEKEIAIATSCGVTLTGTPEADPRARLVEQQLIRAAGREDPEGPGCIVWWEQVWACQLFEPDGATLIGESDGWMIGPDGPDARVIAAGLALEEGI